MLPHHKSFNTGKTRNKIFKHQQGLLPVVETKIINSTSSLVGKHPSFKIYSHLFHILKLLKFTLI